MLIKQYQKEIVGNMLAELESEIACQDMWLGSYAYPVAGFSNRDDGYLGGDSSSGPSVVEQTVYHILKQGLYSEDGLPHLLDVRGEGNEGDNRRPANIHYLRNTFGDEDIIENIEEWALIINQAISHLHEEGSLEWGPLSLDCVDAAMNILFTKEGKRKDLDEDIVRWFFNIT